MKIDLEEIKYNIHRSIYNSKIADIYYNIKNGIPNLIKYFPIIWKDRNWDDHYFHTLMRFKLVQMENMIRKYGSSVNAEKNADNIQHAIDILDRITENNGFSYMDEALKPLYEKFPEYEFKMEFEPCEDTPHLSRMINNDTKEQKELKHQCYEEESKSRESDLDELYSFLREHVKEWWN